MTIRPTAADGSPMPIKEYFARRDARKTKRTEKGLALGLRTMPRASRDARGIVRTPVRGVRRIRRASERGALKERIVHLLGLLDAKINGKECRLGHLCPAYRDLGKHGGQVAYHLIPQKRGDAARFLPENVVWACSRANNGERLNRDLYRHHHITIFGTGRIERIESISRTTADFSMTDLRGKLEEVRAMVEAA